MSPRWRGAAAAWLLLWIVPAPLCAAGEKAPGPTATPRPAAVPRPRPTPTPVPTPRPAAPPTPTPTPPSPGTRVVVVEGSAPLAAGGDRDAAARAARADAVRAAVQRVAAPFGPQGEGTAPVAVTPETAAELGRVLRVLEESEDAGALRVRAEVGVPLFPLLRHLRESGVIRPWRTLVLIREQYLARQVPDSAAQAELTRQLVDAGFPVVAPPPAVEAGRPPAGQPPDIPTVVQWGRAAGADVVITGKASAQPMGEVVAGSGFMTARGHVQVEAVATDTGEVIAAGSVDSAGADLAAWDAARKAVQDASRRMAPDLIAAIALRPAPEARRMRLEVSGFRAFAETEAFEQALARVPGVARSLRVGYEAGTLRLDVDVARDRADALPRGLEQSEALQPFRPAIAAADRAVIRLTIAPP